jgi:hypothetical protein
MCPVMIEGTPVTLYTIFVNIARMPQQLLPQKNHNTTHDSKGTAHQSDRFVLETSLASLTPDSTD